MTPAEHRRTHQRQVLALLLGLGALGIPVAGAIEFGGTPSGSEFAFLGATSLYDFVPVLMLVASLGILVIATAGPGVPRSSLAVTTGTVVALAGGVLALAYAGAAFSLRAGGPFGVGTAGDFGWSPLRVTVVGSMLVTGVVCGSVAYLAVTWLRERSIEERA